MWSSDMVFAPMKRLTRALGSSWLILALTVSAKPAGPSMNDHEVLSRARNAYYSLSRKGFKGFAAAVEPNWEVILGNTATPASLKVFRAVQFSMVVDANGSATVTHEVGPNAAKSELQPTVNRIHADVQRLVAGFFNTWRIFTVNSPFPETEIQIENLGKQYKLTYINQTGTSQAGNVTILMASDLVITEWTLSTPTAKRTVKPQFQKTPDGLLLSSYQGVFNPVGQGIKTTLDFHIEYQDAGGMKLPYKVRFSGMHGNEPVEAELVFRVKS
jgi:hypothetical protein